MKTEQWNRRQFLSVTMSAILAPPDLVRALDAAVRSSYEKVVLAKKPVAYWRLAEARGPTAQDSSGHGHRGTYHGKPVFRERGALKNDPNTAVKLNGQRCYLEIASHKTFSQPTSGRGLTVEAWLRPDVLEFEGETADGYIHWLGKGEAKRHEWALRLYSRKSKRPNRISAYLFNPQGGLGAGAYFQDQLTAGEWLHVVACYEPGSASSRGRPGVHIYKNGQHRLGPPSPGTLYHTRKWRIQSAAGPGPVRLGTYSLKGFLAGGLDEVAIYPRVLTAEEIGDNYRAGQGK
jgi:hypothetical protein